MNEKILLSNDWLFHEGEIEPGIPATKAPVYQQAKTERFRNGPASMYYSDNFNDFGSINNIPLPRVITTERWDKVIVPHDYIISQEPKKEGNNALGFFEYHPAWYRKHLKFAPEDEGKRIVLYFEGVTDKCEVYFNGSFMHESRCGYVPFEIDISDFIRFGEDNVLAVHCIPRAADAEGWWYAGGGITRRVWLEKHDTVSVDRYGIYMKPERKNAKSWSLPAEVTLRNDDYEERKIKVKLDIFSPDEKPVGGKIVALTLPPRDKTVAQIKFVIGTPTLWDVDSPKLYRAVATVITDEGEVDSAETAFGFRTAVFDPNHGFFLNDRHILLKGVCGHGDFGLSGKAVPENIHRVKVKMMKEMGVNAYRCSHYPQDETLMNELDKAGILVMDETRFFSSVPDSIEDLRTLLLRDRNHPSVILWSIGNEESFFITPMGKRIAKAMITEVKKLDDRPVLVANDKHPIDCTVYEDCDVIGINYNFKNFAYDTVHEKFPDKCILSSECCATGSTRGWYYPDAPEHGYISAYDKATNAWFGGREDTWKQICDREWVAGAFQWIAFEHRGEAEWPRICSQSGAIDLYLARKDAFYQNMSHWTDKPMIHLLPHWNFPGREGEELPVFAYTNCEEAELFLNGESLGRQTLKKYDHGEWNVKYTPGTLTVIGYNGGVEVVRDEKVTSGAPTALKLTLENPEDAKANGKNALVFYCTCLDAEGREVPNAAPFVRFHTNGFGKVSATGSDISDHNPVTLPDRKMRAGCATVLVTVGAKPGELRLYADADGLATASYTIELQ